MQKRCISVVSVLAMLLLSACNNGQGDVSLPDSQTSKDTTTTTTTVATSSERTTGFDMASLYGGTTAGSRASTDDYSYDYGYDTTTTTTTFDEWAYDPVETYDFSYDYEDETENDDEDEDDGVLLYAAARTEEVTTTWDSNATTTEPITLASTIPLDTSWKHTITQIDDDGNIVSYEQDIFDVRTYGMEHDMANDFTESGTLTSDGAMYIHDFHDSISSHVNERIRFKGRYESRKDDDGVTRNYIVVEFQNRQRGHQVLPFEFVYTHQVTYEQGTDIWLDGLLVSYDSNGTTRYRFESSDIITDEEYQQSLEAEDTTNPQN